MLSPKSVDDPQDNVQEVAAQVVIGVVYLHTETLLSPPNATYPVTDGVDEYVAVMTGLYELELKVNGVDTETDEPLRLLKG